MVSEFMVLSCDGVEALADEMDSYIVDLKNDITTSCRCLSLKGKDFVYR
jgi:hypothetical protein